MYKAVIRNVTKTEDEVQFEVEYTDGVKTFRKIYPFVMVSDINNGLDQTIQGELERITDLDAAYTAIRAKIDIDIPLKRKIKVK